MVDFKKKAVYRDVMQQQIETYLDRYCRELVSSEELQSAFIRKFEYLHQNTAVIAGKPA